MSLHGTIEVNRERIGWWFAQRISGGDQPDDVNTYEVSVHTGRLGDAMTNWRGTVEHRYGDGAVVLAAKVLAASVASEATR